ncbi:nucleoside hydrolase [Nocardioides pacificus]
MTRPILLDCDTGTDDAVAIVLAALHPDLDLRGVTTVWGNHPLARTSDNTLRVLDLVGRPDVPVHAGLAAPYAPCQAPPPLPGPDDALRLPAPSRSVGAADAVEWLVETPRAATEPITWVATGPLSNVAATLAADPGVVEAVDELVVMGGAHAHGNVTASAETNVWRDPLAAAAVCGAGFARLVLVPLDATLVATVPVSLCHELRAGTAVAGAVAGLVEERIQRYAGSPHLRPDDRDGRAGPVHDALALAYLLDPAVVTLEPAYVEVETNGRLTTGRTVMDFRGVGSETPNALVAVDADRERFHAVLRATLLGAT